MSLLLDGGGSRLLASLSAVNRIKFHGCKRVFVKRCLLLFFVQFTRNDMFYRYTVHLQRIFFNTLKEAPNPTQVQKTSCLLQYVQQSREIAFGTLSKPHRLLYHLKATDMRISLICLLCS
jgi:hypothetical protein